VLKGTRLPLPTPKANGEKIRIACVGDSITEGWMSSNPAEKAYPVILQRLLGESYEVKNYGQGGTCLLRNADQPYRECWGYRDSMADKPDIVLLMLGTNDANRDFNIRRLDGFYADYLSMINEYRLTGASVVVLTSPVLFCNEHNEHLRRVVAWQKEAAAVYGCPVVDVNAFSALHPYFFPDNVHGDDSGYAALAYYLWHTVFGGDLCLVTVQSAPLAAVTLAGVRVPADEEGIASFEVPALKAELHGFHIGYHSNHKTVTVTDGAVYELPLAAGGKELAHRQKAFASSQEGGNPAEHAFDGYELSRWASLGRDEEWLTVDLGRDYALAGVCLRWETAFGKRYEIQVSSDNEHYTTAAVKADGTGGVDELELTAGTVGRYVRMQGRERGTYYGYSLYDFLVFGEEI